MSKPKVSVFDKVQKEFPDFCVEVQRLDVNGLNSKLLAYAKHSEEIEDSKENDEGLAQAKETVKDMSAPYRDAKKALRLKMRYIMGMIKDQGGQ